MDTKLPMGFAIRVESTNWSTCRDALENVLASMKQMQVPGRGVTEAAHWRLEVTEKSDGLNDPPGPPKDAYFCLITWPDGREGLLFPRPGNVPVRTTVEDGLKDFVIAQEHLQEYITSNPVFETTKIRLIRFARQDVVKEFPEPTVEKVPPIVIKADIAEVERRALSACIGHLCPKCHRQMTHAHRFGYICEYCSGIED